MTPQDQIRALAELDGWRMTYQVAEDNKWPTRKSWITDPCGKAQMIHNIPDYLHSRDALQSVLEKFDFQTWYKLNDILCPMLNVKTEFDNTTGIVIGVLMATPAQLAEAILRATGKWRDA